MVVLTKALIEDLKDRVLLGEEISREDALALIEIENESLYQSLIRAAGEITRFFHAHQAHLCSLINAKSNLCAEDCGFCAQSVHFKTEADRYQLLPAKTILQAAKINESQGIQTFCLVTSGAELNNEEFEQMIDTIKLLKAETRLHIDGSLGFLTPERVQRLTAAGMRRFNDNLQTSREYYDKIVTTHHFDKRLETLNYLKAEGMDMCSGGILGMGESPVDRVNLAFELKHFQPECVPINILNPQAGTPLEKQPQIEVKEIIKTIAVFRFVLPKSSIKLAGGRERGLGKDQVVALQSGANGMITGGYLTTSGNSFDQDKALLAAAGLEIAQE